MKLLTSKHFLHYCLHSFLSSSKKLHFLSPVNISAPGSHFPARLRCTANHRLVSAISQEDKQLQSVPSRASITHFQTPLTTPTSMIFSPPVDCQRSSFDRLRLYHLESTWHNHDNTSSKQENIKQRQNMRT